MFWYLQAFRDYFNFKGRATRTAYWLFTLFNILATIAAAVVGMQLQSAVPVSAYILVSFIPALAVSIRRLHDIGNSGWWLLLALIPYLGGLILLLLMVQPSARGDNKWGPNPFGIGDPRDPEPV